MYKDLNKEFKMCTSVLNLGVIIDFLFHTLSHLPVLFKLFCFALKLLRFLGNVLVASMTHIFYMAAH